MSKDSSLCASADQKIGHSRVSLMTSRSEKSSVLRIDIGALAQKIGGQVDVSTAGSTAKGLVVIYAQGCTACFEKLDHDHVAL